VIEQKQNWPHRLKPGLIFVVISPERLLKDTTRYVICDTQQEAQEAFDKGVAELSSSRYQFKKYRFRRVMMWKAIPPVRSGMMIKDCDHIKSWHYDDRKTAFNIHN
jgi:hypothetical protein